MIMDTHCGKALYIFYLSIHVPPACSYVIGSLYYRVAQRFPILAIMFFLIP